MDEILQTVVERLAVSLCRIEVRGHNYDLNKTFAEIGRTWRRFIPEAHTLLDEMYRDGLVVSPKSEASDAAK